jgi:hypothetical protein
MEALTFNRVVLIYIGLRILEFIIHSANTSVRIEVGIVAIVPVVFSVPCLTFFGVITCSLKSPLNSLRILWVFLLFLISRREA